MRRVWILCAAVCLLTSAAIAWGSTQSPHRHRGAPTKRHPGANHFLFGDRKVEAEVGFRKPGAIAAFTARSGVNGTATSISVYVSAHNRAATLIAALYSDKHGHLGRRLTSGHVAPRAGAWSKVLVRHVAVKAGTTYWIVILGHRGTLYFRKRTGRACKRQHLSSCPISAYVTGRSNAANTYGTIAPVGTATNPPGAPRASCGTNAANTPGGPDPWGGCFPGPENTGVPAGTTLTSIPGQVSSGAGWSWVAGDGDVEVTRCGVTLRDVKISGGFTVDNNVNNGTYSASAPCVTLEDSEVDGIVQVSSNDGTGHAGPLVMTDDTVDVPNTSGNLSYGSPVLSANYFATGVNVEGGRLGFACQGNCSITDSYAHAGYLACSGNGVSSCSDGSGSPCTDGCGYHYDTWGSNGIWWNGVSANPPTSAGVILEHDTWSCDFTNNSTAYGELAASVGAGCSNDIGMHSDDGPSNNIVINKNLVVSSPTAYDPHTGDSLIPECVDVSNPETGKWYPYATNITITDNVFQKGSSPQSPKNECGASPGNGAVESWTWGDGNTFSGNTWDDGTALNEPAGPTNTAPPAITGTAGNGNTLRVSNGAWTGSRIIYSYRWFDCGTGQILNCQQINAPEGGGSGEYGSSYTMSPADKPTYASGDKIKAVVTACVSGGGCTNADAN